MQNQTCTNEALTIAASVLNEVDFPSGHICQKLCGGTLRAWGLKVGETEDPRTTTGWAKMRYITRLARPGDVDAPDGRPATAGPRQTPRPQAPGLRPPTPLPPIAMPPPPD